MIPVAAGQTMVVAVLTVAVMVWGGDVSATDSSVGVPDLASSEPLRVEVRVDKVRHALDRLTLNGMLRSRQAPGKHPSFGVTPSCTAPPGYAWMLEVAIHGEHPIDWAALEVEHA